VAFHLKGRRLRRDLKRLIRKQLDAAIKCLGIKHPREVARHNARTHIKKARAILKMLRDPLERYGKEDGRLRDAGHRLSPLRDAEATTRAFDSLTRRYKKTLTSSIDRPISLGLKRQQRGLATSVHTRIGEARALLERSRKSLPGRVRRAASFHDVRVGIEEAYARSCTAMTGLSTESSDAEFHAWRRRIKEHWYQVRLFERAGSAVRRRAKRLEKLESALGDEHDLARLAQLLTATPKKFGGVRTTAIAIGCIRKRQVSLRRQALAHGQHLFTAKPKAFAATVKSWHHALEEA
jgi:hypothetical protein